MTPQASSQNSITPPEAETYRILLPLDRRSYRLGLLDLACVLAQAQAGEVLVLHVQTPEEREEGWTLSEAEAARLEDVPYRTLTYPAATVSKGILAVAKEERCSLILLNWRGQPDTLRQKLRFLLDPVIEQAPCDVAFLKGELPFEEGRLPTEQILLATSSGPHAVTSAQLAFALADHCGGQVTLLTVLPEAASEREEADAHQAIDTLLRQAGIGEAEAAALATRRLCRARRVEAAVVEAAADHDLVFLGAPGGTLIDRVVRGSTPERLAREIESPVIIAKRFRGVTHQWIGRIWRGMDRFLPDLSLEERLDVYKTIRRGARGTVDYYLLIVLSAIIATMGLLLNSGAVIIGAMLVAPLMTPILALGLGAVLGDIRLLRIAVVSTGWGVLLAIGVSALLTWLAPLALFTSEVEARTQPNLFDLSVALAAGIAGAYAVSRPRVSAALPGVAIAAALVPPLGVIGICLATARWAAARGAGLLFGTNLAAIAFAGAAVYLMLGFSPQKEERERHTLRRRSFLVALALLFTISLPLASRLEQEVHNVTLDRTLRDATERVLDETAGLSLSSLDWRSLPGEPLQLHVEVFASGNVTPDAITVLEEAARSAVGHEVTVQLVIIPTLDPRAEVAAPLPSPTPGTAAGLRTPQAAALEAAGGERLGGRVMMLATWADTEQAAFLAMIQPFQEVTGVSVLYERTDDLDGLLPRRIESGYGPDVSALSGPGQMVALARAGHLVPLGELVDEQELAAEYDARWLELGTVEGALYGIFMRVAVKGLIWYRPDVWEAQGFAVPERWDELVELVDQMAAAGGPAPWCIGLESVPNSGWPGTDWLENILLRQATPAVYDEWYQGTLAWTSEPVKQAWQAWARAITPPSEKVFGGRSTMQRLTFSDAGDHLFTEAPGCYMQQQGSFMSGFYQAAGADLQPGEDYSFFLFPRVGPDSESRVEVAGDLFGMLHDTPQARAFLRYLLTPEAQAIWVSQGGAISPNQQVPLESYPNPVSRQLAQLLHQAEVVRFDASDQMPPLMRGSFQDAIIDYVQSPDQLDEILEELETVRRAAYPARE